MTQSMTLSLSRYVYTGPIREGVGSEGGGAFVVDWGRSGGGGALVVGEGGGDGAFVVGEGGGGGAFVVGEGGGGGAFVVGGGAAVEIKQNSLKKIILNKLYTD